MNRTGTLLVALLAACCAPMMPAAVTEPLSQPATGSPLEWQYTPRSITLNDCHLSGIRGPFQFNDQTSGQVVRLR